MRHRLLQEVLGRDEGRVLRVCKSINENKTFRHSILFNLFHEVLGGGGDREMRIFLILSFNHLTCKIFDGGAGGAWGAWGAWEHYWTLLNTVKNYWTLLNTVEHYWTLLNTIEHNWTLLNTTNTIKHYWTLLNTIEHYWTLLNTIEHYWTLLSASKHHWTTWE